MTASTAATPKCCVEFLTSTGGTNREVYANLTPLSKTVMQSCLQFAGHCLRTDDQPISHLVFWNPPGGHPNRSRRKMNYPDTITRDTNLNQTETHQLMRDKATWHQLHQSCFYYSVQGRRMMMMMMYNSKPGQSVQLVS